MPGPTLIQIKRSILTGSTPTLANGELAFTANGDILFIGSNAVTIPIGSKRTPGVLTANQGIVTNSINHIDTIKIGNTIANIILSASGILLSNTDGEGNTVTLTTPNNTEKAGQYYLKADGSWSTVTAGSATPAGANTQLQYNDSGVTGASAGFIFTKDTNNVTIANTLTVGANFIANSLIATHSTQVNSALFTTTGFRANTVGVYPTSNTVGQLLGNTISRWELTANAITLSGIATLAGQVANSLGFYPNSNTVGQLLGNTLSRWDILTTGGSANSTGIYPISNTVGQAFGNTISRWAIFANTLDVTTTVTANGGLGGAGQVLTSNLTGGVYWAAGGAGTLDGLTDVTIAGVANNDFIVYDNVAGQWENHPAGNGFTFAGQVPALLAGSTLTVNTLGAHVNTNLSIQDLTLGGNLTVSGTLSTIDAVNLVVNDSIISLARNNGGNVLDIGMYGQYNDGQERFTGLIWDTTDSTYYLFSNTMTEPTTTLSIADANLRYSVLRTYLISNAFSSNATAVNITATASTSSVLTINTLSVSGVSTLAAQIANSTGFVPTSNSAGQLFGNTISRVTITANIVTTSGGASPDSNTLGTALGTTTQRWVGVANSITVSNGLFPESNTLGTALGSTTQRWVITAASLVTNGQNANSLGLYPISNTVGQLFGNTTARWDLFTTGQTTNSAGIYPVSNTVGQLFGNTISRWEITANTLVLSTALLGTSGGTGLSTVTAEDILVGNTTNGFRKLALGGAGTILQSFGSAVVWDSLDGGTF